MYYKLKLDAVTIYLDCLTALPQSISHSLGPYLLSAQLSYLPSSTEISPPRCNPLQTIKIHSVLCTTSVLWTLHKPYASLPNSWPCERSNFSRASATRSHKSRSNRPQSKQPIINTPFLVAYVMSLLPINLGKWSYSETKVSGNEDNVRNEINMCVRCVESVEIVYLLLQGEHCLQTSSSSMEPSWVDNVWSSSVRNIQFVRRQNLDTRTTTIYTANDKARTVTASLRLLPWFS
jgi:hypothetical protein